MKTIRDPKEMQSTALAWRNDGLRIGLVPTMGGLHEGHLALIRAARPHCDRLVVSLFVNPLQFGPSEDLECYPRDPEGDARKCESAGADLLFSPDAGDLYAPDRSVTVNENKLSIGLCGKARPGHFDGVLTVVSKLFLLCQPQIACFGEKDAQQLRTIRRMVRDLNFPVEIQSVPTVREADGLAMSSRNAYLSPIQRQEAVRLFQALQSARDAVRQGERNLTDIRVQVQAQLEVPGIRIDYIETRDDETLQPVDRLERPTLLAVAAFLGETRLIDNTVLMP